MSHSGSTGAGASGKKVGDDNKKHNPLGFVNERRLTTRQQKIKWTTENDNKLLLIGLGKNVTTQEYAMIANRFPERPTPKAVQERYTKLRAKQMVELNEMHMAGPQTEIQLLPGTSADDDGEDEDDEVGANFTSPTPASRHTSPLKQTPAKHSPTKSTLTKYEASEQPPFLFGTQATVEDLRNAGVPAHVLEQAAAELRQQEREAVEGLVRLGGGAEKKRVRDGRRKSDLEER